MSNFYKKKAEEKLKKKDVVISDEQLEKALAEAFANEDVASAPAEETISFGEAAKVAVETPAETTNRLIDEGKIVMHTAQNVYFKSSIKKWMLVTIEYHLPSGRCAIVGEKELSDSVPVAVKKIGEIFALKAFKQVEKEQV
jgi:UDP-glucose 6-dehydrogenase